MTRTDVDFIRCFIPLDGAGIAIRVWDRGFRKGTDRLLYIPPGVICILPVGIPTSDCVRFSPRGQRRLEMCICIRNSCDPELPQDIDIKEEYFYLEDGDNTTNDISVLGESDKEQSSESLLKFAKLFTSGQLV